MKYLLVLQLCLITACAVELKDKKDVKSSPSDLIAQASMFALGHIGENEPNRYEILIRWKNLKGTLRFSEDRKVIAVVAGEEAIFRHSGVEGGKKLNYLIEQISADGRILGSFPVSYEVPRDYVIDKDTVLTKSMNIDGARVYLKSTITTLEHSLYITAVELISEGGRVQNFDSSAKARRGQKGRNGGNINILSEKAIGHLDILLNAEGGGDGKDGVITPSPHPGCAGTSGGDGGMAGSLNLSVLKSSNLSLEHHMILAQGGRAGRRGTALMSAPPEEIVSIPCHRDAIDGVAGMAGSVGQVCLKILATQFTCE